MSEPLSKVDSAVQGLSSSPPKETKTRRASSNVPGVYNIMDLGMCTAALGAASLGLATPLSLTAHPRTFALT